MLPISACSKICSVRIPSGPSGRLPLCPGGKPQALPCRCADQLFLKKRPRCLRGLFVMDIKLSYRFGTITARKRVTESVWLRMECV